jgi:hypothetical protein
MATMRLDSPPPLSKDCELPAAEQPRLSACADAAAHAAPALSLQCDSSVRGGAAGAGGSAAAPEAAAAPSPSQTLLLPTLYDQTLYYQTLYDGCTPQELIGRRVLRTTMRTTCAPAW